MNKKEYDWEYNIKCRKCNKISRMYLGNCDTITSKDFKIWASEHSIFPIEKQCSCDNGMIMFHDIISYGNIALLNLID